MKRKLLFLSLILLVTNTIVFGQQDKLLTHFIYDKMSLNPGETGMDEGICATSVYRNQWDKVNGAPNSAIFNIEANMNRFFPGGLGISFYHDAIGFTRQNNVLLNYSYPLQLGDVGTLGIGVGLGIQNMGMTPEWVPPSTLNDNTLPAGFTATKFDMNAGLYFRGTAGYYVGISSTHLPASSFDSEGSYTGLNNTINFNSARHYYVMGGYKYRDIHDGGDVEANVLLRTEFKLLSADINFRYIWKNMAYGGLTYRTSDAVAIMLGCQPIKLINNDPSLLDGFIVGYSYDVTTNKLSSISKGSHEILLKYCYYLPPVPIAKSKHPRWL